MTDRGPIAKTAPRLRLKISDTGPNPVVQLVDPEGNAYDVAQDAAVVSASITGEGSEVWIQLRAGLEDWDFGVDNLSVGLPRLTSDDYEEIKGFFLYSSDYSVAAYDMVWNMLVERGLAAPLT